MSKKGHDQLVSLDAIYKKHHDNVYRKIYKKIQHKEIAEDLTSQVFLKVVKFHSQYDESKGSIAAWINRIAENTVIDYYRTSKRDKELLNFEDYEDQLASEYDWFKRYEKNMLIQALGGAFEKLKIQERDMLILKYFKCRTNKEIARIYGLNESTVSTQLFRVIKKLRNLVPKD